MIVGVSPAIRRAVALAERYARTRLAVLIVGATGTGKELVARHIHERSGRPGRLVDVNCCALPREMVESLLFGHRRGAFTGATESTVGHIECSDGGTLFLDELASLGFEAQGKLLRVLETEELQPLGSVTKKQVDLRVLSTAQDDLEGVLTSGRFRRDLFQRVAGVVIPLPRLTDRREDVVPLARHFAELSGRRLEADAERVLLDYDWPGNVRELRLTIERAGALVANGTLPAEAIAEAIELGRVTRGTDVRLSDDRATLIRTCQAYGWHAGRICRALSIGRTTLYGRLREAGLSLRQIKKDQVVHDCSEQSRTIEQGARVTDR